jgi:hypothetical protein
MKGGDHIHVRGGWQGLHAILHQGKEKLETARFSFDFFSFFM